MKILVQIVSPETGSGSKLGEVILKEPNQQGWTFFDDIAGLPSGLYQVGRETSTEKAKRILSTLFQEFTKGKSQSISHREFMELCTIERYRWQRSFLGAWKGPTWMCISHLEGRGGSSSSPSKDFYFKEGFWEEMAKEFPDQITLET